MNGMACSTVPKSGNSTALWGGLHAVIGPGRQRPAAGLLGRPQEAHAGHPAFRIPLSLASNNPRNVMAFFSVSKVSAVLWPPWRHSTCHRVLPPLCRFLMLAMVPLVVAPKGETNAWCGRRVDEIQRQRSLLRVSAGQGPKS